MKKTLFVTLLFGGFLVWSCSNDFEVSAPWKDIPVVYGLMNLQDTAHYIRVEKAFLDPDANALDLAKIADSLYYDNAVVQLERVSNGELFTLQKVDGNLWGFPREPGVFATSPNWLYRIDSTELRLKPGEMIRLRIDRGNNLPIVTAETEIFDAGRLRSPNVSGANNMDFRYNFDTKLEWSYSAAAQIFDATLVINYVEIYSDGSFQEKQLTWLWGRGVRNDNGAAAVAIQKKGIEFYQFLAANLEPNPSIKRIFNGFDVHIVAGGDALEKYVDVGLSNTGITGSQEVPTYTNLSEGRGVFSSIGHLDAYGVQLNPAGRDSLENGTITKALNFQ